MSKGDVATAQVNGEFSIKPEAKQPQLDTSQVYFVFISFPPS
jgi:hypothetical protein